MDGVKTMKTAQKEVFNRAQFFNRVFIDQLILDWNRHYLASHINKGKINQKFLEIKELL